MRREVYAASTLLRFCVCWLVFHFLLFSAASGKLATYVLPCFPPLFILLVDGALELPCARLARQLGWIAGGLAAISAAAALVVLTPIPTIADQFTADERWKPLALAAIVALVAAGLATAVLRGGITARASAIAAALALVLGGSAIGFPAQPRLRCRFFWRCRSDADRDSELDAVIDQLERFTVAQVNPQCSR